MYMASSLFSCICVIGFLVIILGQSWDINLPFVVSLTIRTSSPSGLLLSATDNNGEKYVALYIKQGKVSISLSKFVGLCVCVCAYVLAHMCKHEVHHCR
jgi:hypothetical protein